MHDETEGVSAPYRPSERPTSFGNRHTPRPAPTITLRADFAEHEGLRAAGVLASWLWLCAVGEVRRRGGQPFLSLRDLRRLVDFEELGVKARKVIDDAVNAGLMAKTKDGMIILTDALDERRG